MDKQAESQPVSPESGASPGDAALRPENASESASENFGRNAEGSAASADGLAETDSVVKPSQGKAEAVSGSASSAADANPVDSAKTGETATTSSKTSSKEVAQNEQDETAPEEAGANGADTDMQWYVLKVQSNREKSIKQALERRIRREGLQDYFGEIIIPTEKVVETKGGRKRVVERKLYPGYIMIQMKLTDDTWYLVRGTNGVGDFTGAAGKPIPMEESEIERMLGKERERETGQAKVKIDFSLGEMVKIKGGGFDSFEGTIDAIDEANGKITVLVEIFGRSTPVQLEYSQLERI